MITLYSLLSHFNSFHQSSKVSIQYPASIKFISFFPRATVHKFVQLVWGLNVFMFSIKLYQSIMFNSNSKTFKYDINEFWDCINDGWMREYIYPYDNIYSPIPSLQRQVRLGLHSFRPYVQITNNNGNVDYCMKFDNGFELNLNDNHCGLVIEDPTIEYEIDDDDDEYCDDIDMYLEQ